jgi:hypothetical protein
MHMDYTGLWSDLPLPTERCWRQKNKREVLHLLCGALWHLELASHITGGDFSEDHMDIALNASPNRKPVAPWEDWIAPSQGRPTVAVKTDDRILTICYTYGTSISSSRHVHLQTLLLTDGALRLAGAYDLCSTKPTTLKGNKSFEDILCATGAFDPSVSLSTPLMNLRVCLLLVTALRDSFMHGEKRPGNDRRWKFRANWFAGAFAHTYNLPYSPAIIAQACRKVWEELRSGL